MSEHIIMHPTPEERTLAGWIMVGTWQVVDTIPHGERWKVVRRRKWARVTTQVEYEYETRLENENKESATTKDK